MAPTTRNVQEILSQHSPRLTSIAVELKTLADDFERSMRTITHEAAIFVQQEAKELKQQFDGLYWDLFNQLPDSHRQPIIDDRNKFITIYRNVMVNTSNRISIIKAGHNQSQTLINQINHKIKAPEIKIPEFDGIFEKWLPFKDTFESLVHNNESFSNIQKFWYLTNAVKINPPEANIINRYSVTAENYPIVWNELKSIYDNKRRLLSHHINSLLNIKKATSSTSSEIRRVTDSFSTHVAVLEQLGWTLDNVIEHLVKQKLDEKTSTDWNIHGQNKDNYNWNTLKSFLTNRWKALEDSVSEPKKSVPSYQSNESKLSKSKSFHSSNTNNVSVKEIKCVLCNEAHTIRQCPAYLNESIENRESIVNKYKLCRNCLGRNHQSKECISEMNCRTCHKRHHTTLHKPSDQTSSVNQISSLPSDKSMEIQMSTDSSSSSNTLCTLITTKQTLLATVKLLILDSTGAWQEIRAIIDSASDEHIIRHQTALRLGLKLQNTNRTVIGVNNTTSQVKYTTKATIKSKYHPHNSYVNKIECQVFPDITGYLPALPLKRVEFNLPSNIHISDPNFHVPNQVDMLIGVGIFWDCLLNEIVTLQNGAKLIHTKFGWIVSGEIKTTVPHGNSLLSSFTPFSHSFCAVNQLNEQLEKFWTLEQIETKSKLLTKEEQQCENLYQQTTRRDDTGRYVVKLPLKSNCNQISNNLKSAKQRQCYLEKKFLKDETFYEQYKAFLNEYESLGHMSQVDEQSSCSYPIYYLPHHGVIREESSTTKLRVVFDGSAKSESNISLNDVLMVGPTVQAELYDIIIKFMCNPIAVKADIAKMYRQILVDNEERSLQRIIWRESPSQPFKHYQLNTVTYGTSCAPHLATRTLIQIADDYQSQYPFACNIIKQSFYVDDLLASCESVNQAIKLHHDLKQIFHACGMELRKWASNSNQFIETLALTEVEEANQSSELKALGIVWNVKSDTFSYKLNHSTSETSTMSSVLSEIASIYDPLGFIGPITLIAKLFMKKLWQNKLTWKSQLPENLQEEWMYLKQSFQSISKIQIDRYRFVDNPTTIELHGFSDASIQAYGVSIYIRSSSSTEDIKCKLITAKSRVAPNKQITLARLELCGLLLLSQLANRVANMLNISPDRVFLWSDSLIALHWVKSEPAKLSIFVGNRVAAIHDVTQGYQFNHIRSNQNPADIISRGALPEELIDNDLWWNGPEFLRQDKSTWPVSLMEVNIETEEDIQKEFRKSFIILNQSFLCTWIESRYSSYNKIVNVFINILKFIDKLKGQQSHQHDYKNQAEIAIIRIIQKEFFRQEYKALQSGKLIPNESSIKSLNPFLDSNHIIRIGGRIQACKQLPLESRHQIILPKCNFTNVLIRHIHTTNGHSSHLATLSFIRQRYWPVKAKSIIRSIIHRCIKCFRVNPSDCSQLMANLPSDRINSAFPFEKVSIDYAGPTIIKSSALKNARALKSYIALFKCMTTKAIHLELVSDLTTASFIAALDRFISRRGLCSTIYSDNGTYFEGAYNEFKELEQKLPTLLKEYCDNKNLRWEFITPRAPHAAGFWESGIKQMKYYLKRMTDSSLLTFEELSTLLCRIEAILNSRPISSMSDDPNDIQALTPGHFLIGRPLNAKLEKDVSTIPGNRLQRWEKIQQLQQRFWKQWYDDVVINMQERPKGFQEKYTYQIDDLVLIKEPNIPTMKWLLGRIIKAFPGKDGIIRNVAVKTQHGIKERHIKYLCKLPLESSAVAGVC